MTLEHLCDGEKLGMTRPLAAVSDLIQGYLWRHTSTSRTYIHRSVGVVHSGSHDLVTMDEDTPNWGFARLQCLLTLWLLLSNVDVISRKIAHH